MEKMIKVINDNLRAVINGIKVHKSDTEKSLASIKAEIDEKIAIANEYKLNVENARVTISNLENEISNLERDLDELNLKFGSKDFKEILAAGNKEINTKIIETRATISAQSQKIVEITEKAQALKNSLIKLKNKKIATENTLSKDLILEKYYENRINSIIEYSEENPDKLRDYIDEIPQTELMTSIDESDNLDIKKIIDGSIFEEIDSISSNPDIDENLIKEVLIDNENGNLTDAEEDSNDGDILDLTMTQQLDDIILQANDLIEKSKKINEVEPYIPEYKGDYEPVPEFKEEKLNNPSNTYIDNSNVDIPIPSISDKEEPSLPDFGNILSLEDIKNTNNAEENTIPYDDMLINNINSEVKNDLFEMGSNYSDEEKMLNALNNFATTDNDLLNNENEVIENIEVEEPLENANDLSPLSLDDNSNNDIKTNMSNENILSETLFVDSNNDIRESLRECGLDSERFTEKNLEDLQKSFNIENTKDFINVMRKHNIAVTRIYESSEVLLNVTPQNLDHILSILEETGATSDSISYVFKLLGRVNINALEELVIDRKDYELSDLLFKVINYDGESELAERLGLTSIEESTLRKNTTIDDFKKLNLFADIVIANYNELKKYNVDNLNECITKYPHRFALNPNNFASILDKYDPEDLVRCINKNCAVINKL